MKFVVVKNPIDKEFNWDNFRYKVPTTVIVDDKKLYRLERFLQSHQIEYYIDTRWKTKKKPKALKQTNKNKWIETIYKNKQLQEVPIYKDEFEKKHKENVEYVSG